ncbi:hypothetical protein SDC9_169260 [bioreactor metagenome]|uniref:Twitching motility protein PilT n=1 Tax=bioreactor metagenome TaxID=1076179 RepID=A0A645G4U1_9ZZZZ|nr:hypothetical protein [Oscillospiraceae bacterium]
MIKLIVGLKGTGKTKHLIELVNRSVETSPGNVVCIEKGNKLIFDIRHQVRLIDTEVYSVDSADSLYGLVCGVLAANYDIKDVFIDSALKICDEKLDEFTELIAKLDAIAGNFEINFVITSSIALDNLPEKLKGYLI